MSQVQQQLEQQQHTSQSIGLFRGYLDLGKMLESENIDIEACLAAPRLIYVQSYFILCSFCKYIIILCRYMKKNCLSFQILLNFEKVFFGGI